MASRAKGTRTRHICGLLTAMLFAVSTSAVSADGDVVAIVNAKNKIEKISLQELRLVYSLYRRSWDDGIRVFLILPEKGSSAMAYLTGEIFRRRETQDIADYYRAAVFQQRIAIQPPTADDPRSIALVRKERGAIALIDRARVTDPSVRVLEISDK